MNNSTETILSKLNYYAKNTPDKICLIEAMSGKEISYAVFWSNILKYARNTPSGKYFTGTNAPQIKLEPSAITLVIGLITFLLCTKLEIKNAKLTVNTTNTNEFIAKSSPFTVHKAPPTIIAPSKR